MSNADRKSLQSTLSRLAALIAIISALVPPVSYFGLKVEYEKAAIEFEAERISKIVTDMINRDPEYWRFHQYELDSLAEKRRLSYPDQQTIISCDQNGVLSESKDKLDAPIMSRSLPLLDSGKKVGAVEIRRSMRPLIIDTSLVALLSSLFGILVFFIVRTLPLRALRKAFSSLDEEKERAQITLHAIGDAVITTNTDMLVEYLNPVAEQILNCKRDDAIGLPIDQIFTLVDEKTREAISNPIQLCLTENRIITTTEHSLLTLKDNWEYNIEHCTSPIRDQHGVNIGAVMAFRDVTERIKAHEQLTYMAQYDALTGLPNRLQFQHCLEQALARSERNQQPIALLFLDLDRFKTINDSMGHGVGDTLLLSIAQRLQYSVKLEDTVARLGGDEYAIILEGIEDIAEISNAARLILSNICQPLNINRQFLFVSASIGIAVNEPEITPEALLQYAEIAMYRAKESGRNNYQFFEASMNKGLAEHMQLETALRHAIHNNEFVLHYQPKIELESGRLVGAEALLRWNHPDRGLMPPQKFIPILEETNMIIEAGEWVIREACRQIKEWESKGLHLRVAVNISPKQLVTKNFDQKVKLILEEAGLPGSSLEFEITESIFLSDIEQTESVLNAIEAMGIVISLDDFGTGYSSLGYLKRFPISILKIDKTFVDHIAAGPDHRALAEAMIVMAHALSMKVIAEGVETEVQQSVLRQLDCDQVQGYLISRPLAAEAFYQWREMHKMQ